MPHPAPLFTEEFQIGTRWQNSSGIAAPFAHFYDSKTQKEFLFAPRFTMDLSRFLSELPQIREPLSVKELKVICLDLLRGLAQIHRDGYALLDLKEKNILVKLDLRTYTVQACAHCDFGATVTQAKLDTDELWTCREIHSFKLDNCKRLRQILKGVFDCSILRSKELPSFVQGFEWTTFEGEPAMKYFITAQKTLVSAERFFDLETRSLD